MSLSETFLVSPLSVSGCQLWLDGADPNGNGNIPANGTSISTWVDKSRNNNNASGGIAPIYSSRTIVFNGTTQNLTLPNISSFPSNETWFVVFNFTGSGTNRGWNLLGSSAVTGGRGMQIYRVTSDYNFGPDKWGTGTFAFGPVLQNTTYIGASVYSGGPTNGIFNAYINGIITSLSPQTTSFSGTGITNLGVGSSSTFFWQGSMSEVLYYPSALTTFQREKIEGYLAWKWVLTGNLPANHPYKTSRPLNGIQLPTSLLVPSRPLRNVFVFTPTVIPNCQLWYDASDLSTLNRSGSLVTSWTSKGSNSIILTKSSNFPTYVSNVYNQLGTIRFDFAINQALSNASVANSIVQTNTNHSIFLVHNPNTNNSTPFGFLPSLNAIPEKRISVVTAEGSNISYDIGGRLNYLYPSQAAYLNGALKLETLYVSGGSRFYRRDGTQLATNGTISSSFDANQVLYIGGAEPSYPGYRYGGDYCEIVWFNHSLNIVQIQRIEGYLAWKWGLQTNLPLTHPFRTNPPDLPAAAPRAIPQLKSAFFNPRNISGCSLWLDASERINFTLSGNNITQWTDKSGNGRNATQFNTGFATYDSTQKRVVITTTGQLSSPVPAGTFAAGVSAFILFQKFGANTTFDTLVNRTNNGGPFPAPFDSYYFASGSQTSRLIGQGTNENRGGFANSDLTFRNTNTTLYFFNVPARAVWNESVNGATLKSIAQTDNVGTPTYSDVGTQIYIGTRGDKFTTANVYFYEILFFNRTISTFERQQVEGYLAWKWGLQGNLPSTHPFKLFPPSP